MITASIDLRVANVLAVFQQQIGAAHAVHVVLPWLFAGLHQHHRLSFHCPNRCP